VFNSFFSWQGVQCFSIYFPGRVYSVFLNLFSWQGLWCVSQFIFLARLHCVSQFICFADLQCVSHLIFLAGFTVYLRAYFFGRVYSVLPTVW
jgi:hypothetical protein